MLSKVQSVAFVGVDAVGVTVEVNISSRGFPGFDIVGLPAKVVAESKQRVKTALVNTGMPFPSSKKIVVNLAPADLPKVSSMYDMPLAVGIAACAGSINGLCDKSLFFGELSLDGSFRSTHGAILAAIYAGEHSIREVFVPEANAEEASSIKGIRVYGLRCLSELFNHFSGKQPLKVFSQKGCDRRVLKNYDELSVCLDEIKGQGQAKRALQVAAAGRHNLFMIGPPGVGKTMLARAFNQMLPLLTEPESVEVTKIYSVLGMLPSGNSLIKEGPFRQPHHGITYSSMIGGGITPRPGEVSLAHRGVLFLDEFTQFPSNIIDSLRQPMEDGYVRIPRGIVSSRLPCRFILLAACNPCPCGYRGHPNKKCICSLGDINRYKRKISGPVFDRFDLVIPVSTPDVDNLKLFEKKDLTSIVDNSSGACEAVGKAHQIQQERYKGLPMQSNSELSGKDIAQFCQLSHEAEELISRAFIRYNLSVRSYVKIVKVSRTISDLEGGQGIEARHVAEALQYKSISFI